MKDEELPTVDCMIVGAQKAGTTSLLRYLAQHPRVVTHPHREMGYFLDRGEYGLGYEAAFHRYFGKGGRTHRTRLLGKSVGLLSSPSALRRLAEHDPGCRIVVLLREPVERMRSSYQWEKAHGNEERSFPEVVEHVLRPENQVPSDWRFRSYVLNGDYPLHLSRLFAIFPRESVGVHLTSRLAERPREVLQEVLDLMDLEMPEEMDLTRRHNVTRSLRRPGLMRLLGAVSGPRSSLLGRIKDRLPQRWVVRARKGLEKLALGDATRRTVDGKARARMRSYYEPKIRAVESLLGRNLEGWRVPS